MAGSSDDSATTPTPESVAASLKAIRNQIDAVDRQLVELMNQRASLATQIGKCKNDGNSEIFHPNREAEVFQNVLSHNPGPLDEVTVRAIFREVISGCRALQRMPRVAFLGPEHSYSHIATLTRFGETVEFVEVGSISAVFEEVLKKRVDYGVVPLENSTDGRIVDSLDMFVRIPQIKICDEIRMRIHHNLLANCEQSEIRRIYSKPQALSQCRNWLSKNVPNASLHEVTSTTAAARLVQSEPYTAAVASRQAGVKYGIQILCANIEDSSNNETRFAVIGSHHARRTGRDKTALMFTTPHNPGALADVLMVFKQNAVNITWIESFPSRETKGEYIFFVDFEGHLDDEKVAHTVREVGTHCQRIFVLGSFPLARVED
ncbi:prephenate dehydratase [Tuwongella immobilis]|uniref:Bifunctional chorismate mutase/prephenate dehydratase n=1 Tax=Tuwongella immobilis TaxID=692036 RepID=A0A6C2YSR5_9BACT|nr:prephenate dehydratase [Tuwongella immobilis]VIP04183.1 prephenate dehydratase : Prephenate dehydratase OS=Singulisphaera acidiphila (strain ATCC BAA-1392 / DSM 18658 / VKM B-2454 / MOB10) GN=Sinac_1486 PE=4 SV=1: CM_2: PDT: ACT [Tuwongella immobilis]VTS05730.1 prephenate dehydratase : Prephenate dehydratase OS=Singulisphaera acidiphila (strain ATCC BAA-1392 / DSM 18658 / VKM B-2454 / MOB10) GN=Sinac_1486 PE=4 SV=1: CM_2: PDT: ACT [Tuwongella immobilis]